MFLYILMFYVALVGLYFGQILFNCPEIFGFVEIMHIYNLNLSFLNYCVQFLIFFEFGGGED